MLRRGNRCRGAFSRSAALIWVLGSSFHVMECFWVWGAFSHPMVHFLGMRSFFSRRRKLLSACSCRRVRSWVIGLCPHVAARCLVVRCVFLSSATFLNVVTMFSCCTCLSVAIHLFSSYGAFLSVRSRSYVLAGVAVLWWFFLCCCAFFSVAIGFLCCGGFINDAVRLFVFQPGLSLASMFSCCRAFLSIAVVFSRCSALLSVVVRFLFLRRFSLRRRVSQLCGFLFAWWHAFECDRSCSCAALRFWVLPRLFVLQRLFQCCGLFYDTFV